MTDMPIYCRHPPVHHDGRESTRTRMRRGMRVSAPLGFAIAVTAALACQPTDLTGPSFADGDPAGLDATGTKEAADVDTPGSGAGGNGSHGESW